MVLSTQRATLNYRSQKVAFGCKRFQRRSPLCDRKPVHSNTTSKTTSPTQASRLPSFILFASHYQYAAQPTLPSLCPKASVLLGGSSSLDVFQIFRFFRSHFDPAVLLDIGEACMTLPPSYIIHRIISTHCKSKK